MVIQAYRAGVNDTSKVDILLLVPTPQYNRTTIPDFEKVRNCIPLYCEIGLDNNIATIPSGSKIIFIKF